MDVLNTNTILPLKETLLATVSNNSDHHHEKEICGNNNEKVKLTQIPAVNAAKIYKNSVANWKKENNIAKVKQEVVKKTTKVKQERTQAAKGGKRGQKSSIRDNTGHPVWTGLTPLKTKRIHHLPATIMQKEAEDDTVIEETGDIFAEYNEFFHPDGAF